MPKSPVVRVVDCHVVREVGDRFEFLLLRRAAHKMYAGDYRMVGGKIHPGETAWQAAQRELAEETGLVPLRFYALPVVNRFYEPAQDRLNDIPVFLAVVNRSGEPTPPVVLNDEHDEHLWVGEAEARERLEWPGQRAGVEAAAALLRSAASQPTATLHQHLAIPIASSSEAQPNTRPPASATLPVPSPAPRAPSSIPDTQSGLDARGVALLEVGIRDVRHPVAFMDVGQDADDTASAMPSVATCSLSVNLAAQSRGTHMSRLMEVLGDWTAPLRLSEMLALAHATRERLAAESARVQFEFPIFLKKRAPASGATSWMDYDLTLRAECGVTERVELTLRVPIKSLCPCSKAISAYGAHNQRSYITVTVVPHPSALESVSVSELVRTLELQGSAEVYGVLKREDEKRITEKAYENPKFVEDIVRDVMLALRRDTRLVSFHVTVENFESIHNHTAYAIAAQ